MYIRDIDGWIGRGWSLLALSKQQVSRQVEQVEPGLQAEIWLSIMNPFFYLGVPSNSFESFSLCLTVDDGGRKLMMSQIVYKLQSMLQATMLQQVRSFSTPLPLITKLLHVLVFYCQHYQLLPAFQSTSCSCVASKKQIRVAPSMVDWREAEADLARKT